MEQTLERVEPTRQPLTMKSLLEAGVHFGHQTRRWHPRMKPFIFTHRNGIHIIDLQKTLSMLEQACSYVTEIVASGKNILFVGTKKQAQETIAQEAKRCNMFYINQRWLGGLFTNFSVLHQRIEYLNQLQGEKDRGRFEYLSKRDALKQEKKLARLNRYFSGLKEMHSLPGALFIIDVGKEKIAIEEARNVDIPVVALVDTDCSPDNIGQLIPGNDDAIRSINLVTGRIADAVLRGIERRSTDTTEPDESSSEFAESDESSPNVVETEGTTPKVGELDESTHNVVETIAEQGEASTTEAPSTTEV